MTGGEFEAVVATARPVLENGRALLSSLYTHRGVTTGTVINAKLNRISELIQALKGYVKKMEKGITEGHISQCALEQEMGKLIHRLNSVYVQMDIFMALVRAKITLIELINQLPPWKMPFISMSDNSDVIKEPYEDIHSPTRGILWDRQEVVAPGGSEKRTEQQL